MKDFEKSYQELSLLKEKLKLEFLEYIKNTQIPIIERIKAYEKYAKDLLPVGKWRSDAPRWVFDDVYDLCERYELVDFTDIVEAMSDVYSGLEYDEEGELLFLSEESANKLNKIFKTGLSGTHNDW